VIPLSPGLAPTADAILAAACLGRRRMGLRDRLEMGPHPPGPPPRPSKKNLEGLGEAVRGMPVSKRFPRPMATALLSSAIAAFTLSPAAPPISMAAMR
jgi:hypothetical protein